MTGPPDPQMLGRHQEGLRRGLSRARDEARSATDPDHQRMLAERIRSYRSEIRGSNQMLAELRAGDYSRWAQQPMDELTEIALRRLPDMEPDEDPDAPAAIYATPGLPLLVPASDDPRAWIMVLERWADALVGPGGWKPKRAHKEDPYDERKALRRVAEAWRIAPARAKWYLALIGLLSALTAADERWTGRVGRREASIWIRDVVPAEAGVMGGLVWLAQEALRRAREELRAVYQDIEGRGDAKSADALDRERGPDPAELPAPARHEPEDALDAAEAAREKVADLIEQQRRQETRETLRDLVEHMRGQECGIDEAIDAVGASSGRGPDSIRRTLRRLARRLSHPE